MNYKTEPLADLLALLKRVLSCDSEWDYWYLEYLNAYFNDGEEKKLKSCIARFKKIATNEELEELCKIEY